MMISPYYRVVLCGCKNHLKLPIKRCRIVKDLFRNTKEMYDDLVMEIACGLHNFRVEYRHDTPNPYS
jgi:hypothetical protein